MHRELGNGQFKEETKFFHPAFVKSSTFQTLKAEISDPQYDEKMAAFEGKPVEQVEAEIKVESNHLQAKEEKPEPVISVQTEAAANLIESLTEKPKGKGGRKKGSKNREVNI